MFLLYSVETNRSPIRLSKHATVWLLVCIAICTSAGAIHRVAEIKREIAFREELSRNLNQLSLVTDAIAKKKHLPE